MTIPNATPSAGRGDSANVNQPGSVPPYMSSGGASAGEPPGYGVYDNIPKELRENGQFCGFRKSDMGTRIAKVPFNPQNGHKARVDDPSTFGTFHEAFLACQAHGYDGIGVRIEGPLVAVDLDHCIVDGKLTAFATEIIHELQGYTETSPSGTGVHILFRVSDDFVYDKELYYTKRPDGQIEIYHCSSGNRYVTVTGNVLKGTPQELRNCEDQLLRTMDRHMRKPDTVLQRSAIPSIAPAPQSSEMLIDSDRALISRIQRGNNGEIFGQLFAGDTSCYDNDHSRADLAICNILAYTQIAPDPVQIDRIVRNSGLMRAKWDEPRSGGTYGSNTIALAIESRMEEDGVLTMSPTNVVQEAPPQGQVPQGQPQQGPPQGQAQGQPQQGPPQASNLAQSSTGLTPSAKGALKSNAISAPVLMNTTFPPITQYVPGILTQGVTLLAAAPKSGKSLLILLLAICLSTGSPFLGRRTVKCGVLYLSLEDGKSRTQERLRRMLQGTAVPDELYFLYDAPTISGSPSLFDQLDAELNAHPGIEVIIVDTLKFVLDPNGKEYSYMGDYETMKILRDYCKNRKISIIVIHHTRKRLGENSVFDEVLGTRGITGAVDNIWHMGKPDKYNRNKEEQLKDSVMEKQAILSLQGRDIEENELWLTLDGNTLAWKFQGTQAEHKTELYRTDPITELVKEMVQTAPNNTWSVLLKDIISELGKRGFTETRTPQQISSFLGSSTNLFREDGIAYRTTKINGNGGKRHVFCYASPTLQNQNAADEDTVDEQGN